MKEESTKDGLDLLPTLPATSEINFGTQWSNRS